MPGHRPQKRLGQHFLVSAEIVQKLIDLIAASPEDVIVEIGPGRGALTVPLAASGARVVAVEFDRNLAGPLAASLRGYARTTVLNQDFLAFDPERAGLERFVLVGNLPYNLTSPVVEWAVQRRAHILRAVFMVQREVAARLCAAPGGKDWSPLGIFTQLVFEAQRRFDVGPEHFRPRPKVHSAVVELRPRTDAPAAPEGFEPVVRAAFARRRKQLVNNLAPALVPDAAAAQRAIAACGLPAQVRAEQLTTEDFFNLTRRLRSGSID
ncbi:MAG TPA: 16S rRNA (adenine(1518)-N(6)/adenine(1519)-N(6))-dimethyltransferase RsmA [candidate division Zixibacteria bacterium]|nr:16S rRNA (adenine(1518)-N(6)/adenine(1519)-N(6))-dimethyltransferase RsmA [candidate division Zixibacteria bacterium]